MPEDRQQKLWLFSGLYFAQGVPAGFFYVTLALHLTRLGFTPSALGSLFAVAALPWVVKPLWGVLADRMGPLRPLIFMGEAGMAIFLLSLAFLDPTRHLGVFTALIFLHNLCAAAQDVGTDALALRLLHDNERGRANGFMYAGRYVGTLAGGQGLLFVAQTVGWFSAYLLAIFLVLLPAGLFLVLRLPAQIPTPPIHRAPLKSLFASRTILVAFAFALVVDIADHLLAPMIMPFYSRTLGYSDQAIATLASLALGVAALGALCGGSLCDRFGRKPMVLFSCLLSALLTLLFVAFQPAWHRYEVLVVFAITGALVTGVIQTSVLALFMDLTVPRFAATHFQIYMALLNFRGVWAKPLGGKLAEAVAPPSLFRLSALCEVLPLLLLPLLRLGKDKARSSQEL